MRAFVSRALHFLEQQAVYVLWGIVLLTLLIIGTLDYLTGFEYSFSQFYLLPVALAAWTLGKASGYFICFISGLVWLTANLLAGETYSTSWMPYWNALSRTGFFLLVTYLLIELQQTLAHERALARTDALTGVFNSRAFYETVSSEIIRSNRYHHPLTLIYLDVDDFKTINDRFGHLAGDRLLVHIAQTIAHNIRAIDTIARLGGDEFALLLPETGARAAQTFVPRLRDHLLAAAEAQHMPITFSLGVITCESTHEDVAALIRQADLLMYEVKKHLKDGIAYAVI